MVKLSVVDAQLKAAGCPVRMWGRAEVKELCHVLLPGETIAQAVNGQYQAGFAMLVATDFRILLIDKKPKYLTLKDIRFDMITELDYANRLMDATILIYTPNRELRFTAFNTVRLRKLFTHTQHKVMEIRNHFMMQQFQQQHDQQNMPPGQVVAMGQAQYGAAYAPQPASASNDSAVAQISGPGAAPANQPQHDDQTAGQPAHFYQAQASAGSSHHDSSEEQRKLAIAMGAAGLRSIVHNGKVIKDYMAVPFTQRWRKRPYGYTNTPVTRPIS